MTRRTLVAGVDSSTQSCKVVVRDAEDYVTKTVYSRFGEVLAVQKYTGKASGSAQIGTLPTTNGTPALTEN